MSNSDNLLIDIEKQQFVKLIKAIQKTPINKNNSSATHLSNMTLINDIVELTFEVDIAEPMPIPGMVRIGVTVFNLNKHIDRWLLFREISNVYYIDLKLLVNDKSKEFLLYNSSFLSSVMDMPSGVQFAFSKELLFYK
jgi:hypothetical protein